MQDSRELVVDDEICAIQLFGRSTLECIPPGSVIAVQEASKYARMVEILWCEKRYLAFERDLEERTQRAAPYIGWSELIHAA